MRRMPSHLARNAQNREMLSYSEFLMSANRLAYYSPRYDIRLQADLY
jgi:hypothetical protein